MTRIKKVLRRLLFLPVPLALFVVLLGAGGLWLVFGGVFPEGHPLSYLFYAFSAYALCVFIGLICRFYRSGRSWLLQKAPVQRYVSDPQLRDRIGLYAGTVFNLLYAALKTITGIYYISLWFGVIALYYAVLSVTRLILIRADHFLRKGRNHLTRQWKSYRTCGILLFLVNIALSIMVYLTVSRNDGYYYPGTLIYASAAYTFYRLVAAAVRIYRRKKENPIWKAAGALDFSMALVALFSLQTAMFASFGEGTTSAFQTTMNGVIGGAVCIVVMGLAIYMLFRAQKNLTQPAKQSAAIKPLKNDRNRK